MLLEKVENFPELPGVYFMKDAKGEIIYVGKANSLKKRVKSYFMPQRDSRPLMQFLLPKIDDIEFIVTKSEKEALILENTLIKKHKPKYNVNLKDDKTYYSLKITVKSKFPRIILTRKIKKDGSLHFGPYSSSASVRETIALLRNVFLLRSCADAELNNRARPCLDYQIKKCSAPCMNYLSEEEYKRSVNSAVMFLNGDTAGLIKMLEAQMKKESESLNFESAARARDQIKAIKLTVEKQRAVMHKKEASVDIIGIHKDGEDISITVLFFRGGSVVNLKNHIFLGGKLEEDEALSSFVKQFYGADKDIPDEIALNKEIEDGAVIQDWLTEIRARKVTIKVPQRGDLSQLMDMALENAKQALINKLKSKDDVSKNLVLIKEKLGLQYLPRIVECYDISNIMGKYAVGSKVALNDGALDKASYRKYKIRTKEEADDYGMMREVLSRRFKKIGSDKEPPNLILIDGGRGHLSIALQVLKELGVSGLDVVSIAKEKKLKTDAKEERIYIPGRKNPIVISGLGKAFNMLIALRDEAHRFAITYHKKLRGENATASIFDNIKGLGAKKKALILNQIGGMEELTEEKLQQIEGLTKGDIAKIIHFIHS